MTIEELTERHCGLAAPTELPQFQTDDELDTSETPAMLMKRKPKKKGTK